MVLCGERQPGKYYLGEACRWKYFHRVNVYIEVTTSSQLINRELKGINVHVQVGTPNNRVRVLVSWEVLLGGKPWFLCGGRAVE